MESAQPQLTRRRRAEKHQVGQQGHHLLIPPRELRPMSAAAQATACAPDGCCPLDVCLHFRFPGRPNANLSAARTSMAVIADLVLARSSEEASLAKQPT